MHENALTGKSPSSSASRGPRQNMMKNAVTEMHSSVTVTDWGPAYRMKLSPLRWLPHAYHFHNASESVLCNVAVMWSSIESLSTAAFTLHSWCHWDAAFPVLRILSNPFDQFGLVRRS